MTPHPSTNTDSTRQFKNMLHLGSEVLVLYRSICLTIQLTTSEDIVTKQVTLFPNKHGT